MILSLCATHKKASVPILESLSFKDRPKAIKELYALDFVKECVLVQTCNRVEVHVVVSGVSISKVINQLLKFWSQNALVSRDIISNVIDIYEGREALRHLLSLAAGLESMVVGEDQILGQIRDAYLESKEAGAIKSLFDTVFMKAVNVGRKVRTETSVNRGSVSISSVAVDLAEKYLDDPKCLKALVIGTGEAGTLAAKELARRSVGSVFVANRTYERGVELAKMIGGEAIGFEEIYGYLSRVNLVIVAVSATKPLLTFEGVKEALKSTGNSSNLFIVDISQPRCVEEAVGDLPGVNLKSIDDLREIVEENLQKRLGEAGKAREIVLRELEHLEALLKKMVADPIISSLCRKVENIRRTELSKALRMMKGINEDQRLVIENLTKELAERILQLPIENLRNGTLNEDNSLLLAAKKLFNLKVKD